MTPARPRYRARAPLARASTSGGDLAGVPPLIDDEPTLTTIRDARGMSASGRRTLTHRVVLLGFRRLRHGETFVVVPDAGLAFGLELCARGGLGVHAIAVVLSAGDVRRRASFEQARVGAARSHHELRRGGERRLPVELDAVAGADDDG